MRTSTNSENRVNVLRRTAKEVKSYKVQMRILTSALALIVLLLILLYIVAVLYKKTGSFTVSLNKFDMTQYGLTLSESREMTYKTSHLNARIVEEMTNIAGSTIPDNVDMIDGEHNGDNHIAYTFYVQNGGETPVSYEHTLLVSNITKSLDEAIRIKLYKDGEPVLYAKTASDGSGAEPGTTEFYSATEIAKGRVEDFQPGDITKFTVVIWIEGNDPDCIDWLIGGELKVEMDMEVIQ